MTYVSFCSTNTRHFALDRLVYLQIAKRKNLAKTLDIFQENLHHVSYVSVMKKGNSATSDMPR